MSDMADTFNGWREHKKEKKLSNLEYSTKLIESKGFEFTANNDGLHLVISHNGKTVDFWPSTGKYFVRGNAKYGRGVKRLIKELEEQ